MEVIVQLCCVCVGKKIIVDGSVLLKYNQTY